MEPFAYPSFLGMVTAILVPLSWTPSGQWSAPELVGDFNNDAKLDLAVATGDGIVIHLGNGDGTFHSVGLLPSLLPSDPADGLLALADLNGDGKLDILKVTQNNIVNVALGVGDGTFQQSVGFQVPSILNLQSAVAGDFNQDGNPDLAFAGQSDVVTILLGNGDGTFKSHIEYSVPSVSNNVTFMVAADFNGDAALDLALADFSDSEVCVFLNQPVAVFAPRSLKFANQGIDTVSPQQSVTLTNVGAAPLAITTIAASDDFGETNDCASNLSIAKHCTISVAFAPTADGARTGTLAFTDNSSVVPQMLALSGTGTGAGFLISVASGSSASQTVSAGQPASYSLVFTPAGGFNGTITLACSGAPIAAKCTATPASLSVTGQSAVTSTINVATTAAAFTPRVPTTIHAPPVSLRLPFEWRWLGLLLGNFSYAGFACHLFPVTARQPARLALAAVAMLALVSAGCGGGGGSVSTGPPASPPPSASHPEPAVTRLP